MQRTDFDQVPRIAKDQEAGFVAVCDLAPCRMPVEEHLNHGQPKLAGMRTMSPTRKEQMGSLTRVFMEPVYQRIC